ncbi:MAG: hypothetical protein R3330_06395, partial [Saprospiraceae bacterium]|nr:hypothetical protein [Saprospiraceae bacterium]
LAEKGGYWCDTDMVCLQPFRGDVPYVFSSQHVNRRGGRTMMINNGVMLAPQGCAMINWCYETAASRDPGSLKWGETGPRLVDRAVVQFGLAEYVAPPREFCPINWWEWDQCITREYREDWLTGSRGVHLWNEMWRRNGVEKEDVFAPDCLYSQLRQRFLN